MELSEYIKNLETIVNIDSGSYCKEGIKEIITFFKNLYKGWEIEVHDKTDNPVMVIKNRKSDDIDFLFMGHLDTVFPEGESKKRPFSIENNIAKGPGVLDMKSGCLLIYETVKELKDSNKNICIIYNTDEEIGSLSSKDIIKEEGSKAKYVFVFEPARENGNMVSERKGIISYEIDFIGKAAHSGVNPQDGINANIEACRWALELYKLQNLKEKNSVNIGIINGGVGVNIISPKCTIKFEARSFDINFFEIIKNKVDELIKSPFVEGIEIKIVSHKNTLPLSMNENTKKLIDLYEETKKEMKINNLNWESTGGGSDANILGGLNIAIVDGAGPVGGNMHNENEYLNIDTIKERYEVNKRVLEKLMNN